jgi:hypothetical protein
MKSRNQGLLASSLLTLVSLMIFAPTQAQTLASAELVKALQKGGHFIVMRHAASPRTMPDQATANADNTKLERQLDETGRSTATAMGGALKSLKIPVGTVYSSPTYRAMETAKLMGLAALAQAKTELGEGAGPGGGQGGPPGGAQGGPPQGGPPGGAPGAGMQPATPAQTTWLKTLVAGGTKGSNTLVVTQMPVIAAAFSEHAQGLADGEAVVLSADGKGGVALVARVKIEEWSALGK